MSWGLLITLSLGYSLAYCLVFTAIIIGGMLIAPDSMVHDYPPAIQRRYGPKSTKGIRVARAQSVLTLLSMVAVPTVAMIDLSGRSGVPPGFWSGFVFGLIVFVVLNVYDILVLDWWLFCTVQPRFMVLPGTEGMPEYADRLFHVKVLVPKPVPWPLLLIPGYGVAVGAVTAIATAA